MKFVAPFGFGNFGIDFKNDWSLRAGFGLDPFVLGITWFRDVRTMDISLGFLTIWLNYPRKETSHEN